MNVLMAYATKNGSTQQVADAVAVALRERGAQVTLLPARAAGESVAGYDLVVLGAPLYSGRWHRDAHRFLRRHRRELAAVPVAVFAMGPRTDTEEAWQRSRAQLTGPWPSATGSIRSRSPSSAALTRPGAARAHGETCGAGRSSTPGPHRPWPPRADLRKTVRRQASRRRHSGDEAAPAPAPSVLPVLELLMAKLARAATPTAGGRAPGRAPTGRRDARGFR